MAFITLRQLAFEFRRMEAGGDPSPDFHIPEAYAILLARQCLAMLIKPQIFENYNDDDRSLPGLFIAHYTVNVLGDVNHRYINIPEFFMSLDRNRGLKIAPVEEPTHEFIPRNTPGVTYNLESADAEQQHTYYLEGLKAFFDKEMELAKVLVKCFVPAPASISEDSPLPIYPEQQIPLLTLMRQTWADRSVQDKVIDGNKDLGVKMPFNK